MDNQFLSKILNKVDILTDINDFLNMMKCHNFFLKEIVMNHSNRSKSFIIYTQTLTSDIS